MTAGASPEPGPSAPRPDGRSVSIDLLRGLDVWLMLLVVELGHVTGTPVFLRHHPSALDGMTIVDVVFPAFLFIVGLSLPFSLESRRLSADSSAGVWRHVAVRGAGLLVMGVFIVNRKGAAPDGLLPPAVWNLLMFTGLMLAWLAPPADPAGRRRQRVLRAIGIVLLVALAFTYRREGGIGLIQLRPSWWGILGIIGWSYLVAATVFLLARGRTVFLLAGVVLLYGTALADQAGLLPALAAIRPVLDIGGIVAPHAAITLSGVMFGLAFLRSRGEGQPADRVVAVALAGAIILAAAGLSLHALREVHPAFWLNKDRATVPWCLLSSAWTLAAWAPLVWAYEGKRLRWAPRAITTAGENALVAYLLPGFLVHAFATSALLLGTDVYKALGTNLTTGVPRAIVCSAFVVWVSHYARRRSLWLQL